MKDPSHIQLARLNTPLRPLREDPAKGGAGFWLKRDDLTGAELSGNKVRKLEYLLPEAKSEDATVLVTCGGIQSNHARATALVAIQNGFKAHLILRGTSPSALSGNLLLSRLTGAEITWVTPEQYQEREKVFEAVENSLRAQGEVPFRIPEGGSNATGVFGYRRCYQEILEQCSDMGISPDFVYVAVGSGGTLAGLLAGWAKNQYEGPTPVGIPVCDDSVFFRAKITHILEAYHKRWGAPIPNSDQIQLLDGFVGDGYAKSRPEELEELISLVKMEGLLLDPVYTLKAFLGARAHRLVGDRKDKPAIFIHTGGLFGLFGAKDTLPKL